MCRRCPAYCLRKLRRMDGRQVRTYLWSCRRRLADSERLVGRSFSARLQDARSLAAIAKRARTTRHCCAPPCADSRKMKPSRASFGWRWVGASGSGAELAARARCWREHQVLPAAERQGRVPSRAEYCTTHTLRRWCQPSLRVALPICRSLTSRGGSTRETPRSPAQAGLWGP